MSLHQGRAVAMAARNFCFLQCPLKASNSIVSSRSITQFHMKINQTADKLRQIGPGFCSRDEISFLHSNKSIPQHKVFSSGVDTDSQLQQQALNSSYREGQDLGSSGHRKSARDDTSSKNRKQSTERLNIENDTVSLSLHKLNQEIGLTGRAYLDQVISIFLKMKQSGTFSSNDALLLLRCCGNFLVDETPATRSDISEKLWAHYKDVGVPLDVRHYNTLLKNRLENEMPDFEPAEFLDVLDANGIEAGIVTLQHFIAKFCSKGNIQSATTILEHMEQHQVTVNKNVFHSLIVGHCRSENFEAAKSIMKEMVKSGLDDTSDSKMIYVMELARAGKDFEDELEKLVTEGEEFSDQAYLKLIVLLLQKGDIIAANEIVEKLPKASGFFQEIRNFIPNMIDTGELELPYKLYKSFLNDCQSHGGETRNHNDFNGRFFLEAMIRNRCDPRLLCDYLEKMVGSSPTNMMFSRILEQCSNLEDVKYGQSVYDEILKRYGNNSTMTPSKNFLIQRVGRIRVQNMLDPPENVSDDIIQSVIKMGAIGLQIEPVQLAKIIIPNAIDGTKINPEDLFDMYKYSFAKLKESGTLDRKVNTPDQLANAIIKYTLNRRSISDLENTTRLIFRWKSLSDPMLWNISLASEFIKTKDQDSLITILGLVSLNKWLTDKAFSKKHDVGLFQTLNHIITRSQERTPEDLLVPILSELSDCKIGIPSSVIETLKKSLKKDDAEIDNLLNQLKEQYEKRKDVWNHETFLEFETSRRRLHSISKGFKGPSEKSKWRKVITKTPSGFNTPDNIQKDIRGLEKPDKLEISKRQKDNSKKTESDKYKEEANKFLEKAIEKGDAIEVFDCYKDLFEKGTLGKRAARTKIVDKIIYEFIRDNDQKIQITQILLNDKCFTSLVNRRGGILLPLIQEFTRAQLEGIINNNSSPENGVLYRKLKHRRTYLFAKEDPEGFMKSLESSTDLHSFDVSTGALMEAIQGNTKNMEKLLTISENHLESLPRFAFVTLTASLDANQPEAISNRLWKMLKEGELLSKDHLYNILQISNIPLNIKEDVEKKLKENERWGI